VNDWLGVIGPEDDDVLVAEDTGGRGLLSGSDVIGNPASDVPMPEGDILHFNLEADVIEDDQPTEPFIPILRNVPVMLNQR
jgi:hypothetical protein